MGRSGRQLLISTWESIRNMTEKELVNHPTHYLKDSGHEVIDVIEAWSLDFCLGNAVKYIARAGRKNKEKSEEDLRKAIWYLERSIENKHNN